MSLYPSYCLNVGIEEPEKMTVVKQQFNKQFPIATNTHATIEEFLDASLSMQSVSYQR